MSEKLLKVNMLSSTIMNHYSDKESSKIEDVKVEILSQRTKKVDEQLRREIEILRSFKDDQNS